MIQRGRKSAMKLAGLRVNGDPPRLKPPDYLNNDEQTLFTEIIEACSPHHFTRSNIPLLVSYVQSTLLSRTAVKKAAKDAAMLALWEKSTRMQATLATRLRLSVQSRADPKTIARGMPVGRRRPWELRAPWEDEEDAEGKT